MKVMEYLEDVLAKYEVTHHRPTFTAQHMAAEEHVPGMEVAKPVIIRADDEYYMCVLPACCKLDLDAVKSQLGFGEVKLIEESEMVKIFSDCELGAEPPLGNLYGLTTLMDKSLEKDEYIVFQAGSHDTAIRMEMDEYKRLTSPHVLALSYRTP